MIVKPTMKNMTGELAQNYDFDGFWLDWGSLWASIAPCYCEFCAKHYKSATGCELPAARQGPDWEKYIRWRRELNASVQAVEFKKEAQRGQTRSNGAANKAQATRPTWQPAQPPRHPRPLQRLSIIN